MTMRYYKFSAAERKLVMVEAELPEPGPGQVRVRVAAASLNYRDVYMLSRFGDVGIDNRIPMSDASGAIDAVGEGAARFRIGDRVATIFFPDWISGGFRPSYARSALGGETADGVLSEYLIVPERALVVSPTSLSDVEVATLPCAAVTAWHALFERAPIEPDDRVLIQGTGGVALFGLQFAHAVGVRCIVLSSSDDKLERACKLDASDLINYRETPDWHLAVQEITQKARRTFWRSAARTPMNDPCNAWHPTAPLRKSACSRASTFGRTFYRFPVVTRISWASRPVHANISKT
jgi:NADPH:quinone reductase-like Zn-dependent oxidoreductase